VWYDVTMRNENDIINEWKTAHAEYQAAVAEKVAVADFGGMMTPLMKMCNCEEAIRYYENETTLKDDLARIGELCGANDTAEAIEQKTWEQCKNMRAPEYKETYVNKTFASKRYNAAVHFLVEKHGDELGDWKNVLETMKQLGWDRNLAKSVAGYIQIVQGVTSMIKTPKDVKAFAEALAGMPLYEK